MSAAAAERSDFKIRYVSEGPQQLSQRFSLARLLAPENVGDCAEYVRSARNIRTGIAGLMRLWRSRVEELTELGWLLETPWVAESLLNCPPATVSNWGTARPCHFTRICPFCWARSVTGGLYERLATAQAQIDSGHAQPADLIEAVSKRSIPRIGDDLQVRLRNLSQSLCDFRRVLGRHADGAFSAVTIEPEGQNWLVTKRLILLVRPNIELSLPGSTETTRYQRWSVDSGAAGYADNLPSIVGRVAEYPTGLLLGDCEASLEILVASSLGRGRSPRLSRTFGLLRNQSTKAKMAA